jgi:NADPH:quinone reductase-like Zn-dependent oxidoreductase
MAQILTGMICNNNKYPLKTTINLYLSEKMKVAVYYNYGPPWTISLKDIVKPIPKNNEELIKVYAGTVNRTDSGFRSAEYFISRFWTGLFKPKSNVLENEFAGIVEEIGQNVTTFKKGDKVFGYNDKTCGGPGGYLTIA